MTSAGNTPDPTRRYAFVGFWARALATVIDSVLILALTWPVLMFVYGTDYFFRVPDLTDPFWFVAGPADFFLSFVFPVLAILLFWCFKRATPGKMVIASQIIDSRTGGTPTVAQYVIRYVGYFVAALPLGLGFFWIAFDSRKQGWHDKMARTLVVYARGSVNVAPGKLV